MTTRTPHAAAMPPWLSALSMELVSSVGAAGTAWLRLSMGALMFVALARPPLRAVRHRDVPALLGLGTTTGLLAVAFLAAIERIPPGIGYAAVASIGWTSTSSSPSTSATASPVPEHSRSPCA